MPKSCGGVFLLSFILDGLGMYEPVASIGTLMGPLLVWTVALFLLVDLGSIAKVSWLFFNTSTLMTSWMARGVLKSIPFWNTPALPLLFLLLITLGGYLEIVRQTGSTAAASIRLLKTPLFIGGVIIAGLLLPLGLLLHSLSITNPFSLRVLSGITSTLVLAGGLCLRYSIIRGGIRLAVR